MSRRRRPGRRPASLGRLAHPRIECLEARLALAVGSETWTLSGDTSPGLTADTIVIERDASQPGTLRATVNGVVVGTRLESQVSLIRVFGGRGDDTITVNVPGNKRIQTQLFGNAGNDTITAGDQHDEIYGGRGRDTIFGGRGRDRIFGDGGDDTINGGDQNDVLFGGPGKDSLVGGAGSDALRGDEGDDTLRGGDGRNSLDGGTGRDSLYGVAGRDKVRQLDAGESLIGNESTNPLRLATEMDQLKTWYVDTAMARWGNQLGKASWYGWWYYDPVPFADLANGAMVRDSTPAANGDFSGTNNQVAGVDEGDRVETDGEHLFVLAGDGVDILNAWPADSLAVVSHVTTDGDERFLFLHGTRLTVISQQDSWGWYGVGVLPMVGQVRATTAEPYVTVTVIDVADTSRPTVLEKTAIDGWLVDARAIGGRVVVVTQDGLDIPAPGRIEVPSIEILPEEIVVPDDPQITAAIGRIAFPFPGDGRRYVYEDEAAYRARLDAAWNDSVLPGFTVTVAAGTTDGTLVTAGHTYLPVDPGSAQLLSVTTFTVDDETPGLDASTAVAGISGSVYASASRLYVSASHFGNWWDFSDVTTTTNIYQFDLEDAAVPLTAMGAVPGLTINQFSLDEQDGLLRVATTDGFGARASSGVYVLAASGGNLQTVGSVSGLAPGERIFSVRFAGDLGYVCTFLQVDPLFVIDLGNPAAPQVVGELKIPGFSSYLQPLDATHLLGVGHDADPDTGRVRGLQLSIFDVSDPAAPRRTATYTFPGDRWGSWSAALWDHHALSWFPEQGILALPVQQGGGWSGSSGLVVFRVDLEGETGFTNLGEIAHDEDVQRSVRIGEFLYSVSVGQVKVHRLTDPDEEIATAALSRTEPRWPIYLA